VFQVSVEVVDRRVVKILPDVTLQEMLVAFKDVVQRAAMFAHHHVQRERAVGAAAHVRHAVGSLEVGGLVPFVALFTRGGGRMGVTVTFVALLELVREGLVDVVQAEPYAPLHAARALAAMAERRDAAEDDIASGESAS
jgi:segregation and condensation protein A